MSYKRGSRPTHRCLAQSASWRKECSLPYVQPRATTFCPGLPRNRITGQTGSFPEHGKTRRRHRFFFRRLLLFEMNNASLPGINRGLGPIAGTHFIEHGAYMNSNGFFRDVKIFGDLAVAASLSNASQDLGLSRGK